MNDGGGQHFYHAHALGVAGKIVRPAPHLIASQATTSLSPMGGYGSDHVRHFEAKGVVSFRSAFVEVAGSYDQHHKSHTTVASAVIEGLNIMGMVTADRVVARVASRHPKGTEIEDVKNPIGQQGLDEPSISPIGSYFDNLKIGGVPIDARLETHKFHEHGTFSKVKEKKEDLKSWMLSTQLAGVKNKHSSLDRFCHGLEDLHESHGIFLCSLVNHELKSADGEPEHGLKCFGSVIYIPGFGVVHLAELLIERHSRRLNMLRIHLGSPIEGDLSVGTAFSNGSTYPPIGGGGG